MYYTIVKITGFSKLNYGRILITSAFLMHEFICLFNSTIQYQKEAYDEKIQSYLFRLVFSLTPQPPFRNCVVSIQQPASCQRAGLCLVSHLLELQCQQQTLDYSFLLPQLGGDSPATEIELTTFPFGSSKLERGAFVFFSTFPVGKNRNQNPSKISNQRIPVGKADGFS